MAWFARSEYRPGEEFHDWNPIQQSRDLIFVIRFCSKVPWQERNFTRNHFVYWLSQNANVLKNTKNKKIFGKELTISSCIPKEIVNGICQFCVCISVGHVTLCFWRFVTHSDKSQTLSGKSGSWFCVKKLVKEKKISTELNGRISDPIFPLINEKAFDSYRKIFFPGKLKMPGISSMHV